MMVQMDMAAIRRGEAEIELAIALMISAATAFVLQNQAQLRRFHKLWKSCRYALQTAWTFSPMGSCRQQVRASSATLSPGLFARAL